LVFVAKVPQVAADDHALGRVWETVETGGRRASKNGLPNAIQQPLREPFRVEGK
jgi:hypothetical protein